MLQFLVNFSFIAIGLLGLLTLLLLLLSYKHNILTNVYLLIIFTIVSLRFIYKGIYEIYQNQFFEITFKWPNSIFLLIVPCFYLYFKTLLNNNKRYNYKDLLHFIYPIINIFFLVIQRKYLILTKDTTFIFQFGILFVIVMYLILSFQLLNRKLWKNNNLRLTLGKHYHLIKSWTQFFYIICVLSTFRLLLSFYSGNNFFEKLSGFSYIIFSIVLWLIVFIKILAHPEILHGLPKLEEKLAEFEKNITINSAIWKLPTVEITNIQDQKLTISIEKKITPYIQDIDNFINATHPFRDPNFSIKELSITLHIPTSHLAYIFKYHCIMPFVEFKKYCKIEDATIQIKDKYLNTNTLESLSNKTGFISYNTFYSSFKKKHKVSPKEYIDSISRV
jgi:AraC-like DNA-binding protein